MIKRTLKPNDIDYRNVNYSLLFNRLSIYQKAFELLIEVIPKATSETEQNRLFRTCVEFVKYLQDEVDHVQKVIGSSGSVSQYYLKGLSILDISDVMKEQNTLPSNIIEELQSRVTQLKEYLKSNVIDLHMLFEVVQVMDNS